MKESRRAFLKTTSAVTAFVTFGSAFAKGKSAKTDETKATDLPLVKSSDMTKALKYYEDGSKVPAADRVAKAGVEGPKQNCANCMFYKVAGKNAGREVGKCQLLPEGHVPAAAWCMSWAAKPKV